MGRRAGKLNVRYRGFTIVELLIVIVVIAILAAITIVTYNGITQQAIESALKSDLKTNATGLEVDKTLDGSYPSDGSGANRGQGLKASSGNALTYVQKPYGYCVSATNARTDKTYVMKSAGGEVAEGTCDAMVATTTNDNEIGAADGIAVDMAGNIYLSGGYNNFTIRKITPGGVISTLAGTGVSGYVDGPGVTAQFGVISNLTVDATGNIYAVDQSNDRIRKITPSGVVSTVAGGGSSVGGIAVDAVGAVYVVQDKGCDLRKIFPGGIVTTIYRLDPCAITPTSNHKINDIAIDANGTLYLAEITNNRIRKISPGGVVSTLAGSGIRGHVDGPGATAQLFNPRYTTVDASGTVYVLENYPSTYIRAVSPAGVVSTLTGRESGWGYVDGTGAAAQFYNPGQIAAGSNSTLYVLEGISGTGDNRIRKITQ